MKIIAFSAVSVGKIRWNPEMSINIRGNVAKTLQNTTKMEGRKMNKIINANNTYSGTAKIPKTVENTEENRYF